MRRLDEIRHLRAILAVSALLAVGGGAAGCATVGPDYTRPAVEMPEQYRGEVSGLAEQAMRAGQAPLSIADTRWSTLFVDEQLRELIATALENNLDVQIAANRILQAEALLGLTRSSQWPSLDAEASGQGQRTSVGTSDGNARVAGVGRLGASAFWEVDFWGKYRRATESARAQLLATEWGRRAVVTSLVSQVAAGYYVLLELDQELAIATRTRATREESLRLTEVRERGGATSLVDVRQAEQLVHEADAAIVELKRLIARQENLLSVLVGRYPGPIARGRPLTEQPRPPDVPPGLPSALLERRPDIQQAEQLLIAANAEIGATRAAHFPQIALTGAGGFASTALSALFTGPAAAWSAVTSLTQPVFNAGRLRSQSALAEAQREEATLVYQRTIQNAFREVADALESYERTRELRTTQERLVEAAQDARRLADLRYQGGAASYLEVLDSDTRLFNAELRLARAQLDELIALVDVYRALGGGWEE